MKLRNIKKKLLQFSPMLFLIIILAPFAFSLKFYKNLRNNLKQLTLLPVRKQIDTILKQK